jgi:hypothetical protein
VATPELARQRRQYGEVEAGQAGHAQFAGEFGAATSPVRSPSGVLRSRPRAAADTARPDAARRSPVYTRQLVDRGGFGVGASGG